jgi:hypothetical protein
MSSRRRAPKVDVISHAPVVSSHVATGARQNVIHRSCTMALHVASLVLEFGRPVTMHVLSSVVKSVVFVWLKSAT